MTFSGIASVLISSVVALYQKKIKRLLAYSAIGHVGFILLAFSSGKLDSVRSALIYLVIYMIMNLGLFSLLIGFSSRGFLFKYLIAGIIIFFWVFFVILCFGLMVSYYAQ